MGLFDKKKKDAVAATPAPAQQALPTQTPVPDKQPQNVQVNQTQQVTTPTQQPEQASPAVPNVKNAQAVQSNSQQAQQPTNQTITNQPISASLATPEQKPNAVNSQQAANLQQAQPGLQGQNPTPTVTKRKKSSLNEEKRIERLNGYSYTVINSNNKKEKGYFDAETEDDVRAFLEGQDYKILEIKPKSAMDIDITGPPKLKPEDLSFSLTQLSTYIKSGIPLVDSMRILAKQARKPAHKKIYGQVVYELLKGETFSVALARQGKVFPPLLINMVKTSEMTGDLPSILDDMAEYYTSMNQTRKQMKSAMTYPIVVLSIALGVLVFMLVYLVPQFATMFESQDAKLPAITLIVLGVSDFIQNYYLVLIGSVVAVILIFRYMFNHIQSFKKSVQIILMHIPVVSKIIIYNEIANFTKTFASLLNHGVFITDSMEILQKITDNEVFKEIINNTLENLSRGEPVSAAFRGQWAIPVVAYEMIVTGENTGQLGLMMEKVSQHFQAMHKTIIDQMKSLMEPLMIVFLAGIVGVILLSIVTPMFSIYSQIE